MLHMSPKYPCIHSPLALLVAAVLAACITPVPTQRRTVAVGAGTCSQPLYPAEARRSEATGTTTLEFEVNAEGKVTRIAIIGSSGESLGHKSLDSLALETLSKCVFPAAPGLLPATAKISYVWQLKD